MLCQGTGATRPFTAGTANAFAKGGVTQPPSPSRRAWASGAPSPLVSVTYHQLCEGDFYTLPSF